MVDRLKYIFVWDIINHTGARIVLWSWTRHLTLITVPLTAQVYTEMATGEFYAWGGGGAKILLVASQPRSQGFSLEGGKSPGNEVGRLILQKPG